MCSFRILYPFFTNSLVQEIIAKNRFLGGVDIILVASVYHANNFKKTDHEVAGEKAVTNIAEASYGAYTASLAAGMSTFVRMDLIPIIESDNGLLVDGFLNDITIEINTRQASQWCTSATEYKLNTNTLNQFNKFKLSYLFHLIYNIIII